MNKQVDYITNGYQYLLNINNMSNKKEIIICVGIPGSGKSTLSKTWISENPENRVRLNGEDILNAMTGGIYVKDVNKFIKLELIPQAVENFIDKGKSIVLDNTHMDPKYFYYIFYKIGFILLAKHKERDYNIIIKDFTGIDPEVCINRDSKRIKPVGRDEIEKCYISNLDAIKECISDLSEKIENEYIGQIRVKIDKIY